MQMQVFDILFSPYNFFFKMHSNILRNYCLNRDTVLTALSAVLLITPR